MDYNDFCIILFNQPLKNNHPRTTITKANRANPNCLLSIALLDALYQS